MPIGLREAVLLSYLEVEFDDVAGRQDAVGVGQRLGAHEVGEGVRTGRKLVERGRDQPLSPLPTQTPQTTPERMTARSPRMTRFRLRWPHSLSASRWTNAWWDRGVGVVLGLERDAGPLIG